MLFAIGMMILFHFLIKDLSKFTEFKATVCVSGLKAGELAIKDYSENDGMLESLIYHGYIKPPHRYIRSGYVDIPICKLTDYARQYMEEQWGHDDS